MQTTVSPMDVIRLLSRIAGREPWKAQTPATVDWPMLVACAPLNAPLSVRYLTMASASFVVMLRPLSSSVAVALFTLMGGIAGPKFLTRYSSTALNCSGVPSAPSEIIFWMVPVHSSRPCRWPTMVSA